MPDTAKLFTTGGSQAVRLPAAYRFDGECVFIRRDADTGDVILSPRASDLMALFKALDEANFPDDFLSRHDRAQGEHRTDPFAWADD